MHHPRIGFALYGGQRHMKKPRHGDIERKQPNSAYSNEWAFLPRRSLAQVQFDHYEYGCRVDSCAAAQRGTARDLPNEGVSSLQSEGQRVMHGLSVPRPVIPPTVCLGAFVEPGRQRDL